MNSDILTIHALDQIHTALFYARGDVAEILESAKEGDIGPVEAAKSLANVLQTLQSTISENFKMP